LLSFLLHILLCRRLDIVICVPNIAKLILNGLLLRLDLVFGTLQALFHRSQVLLLLLLECGFLVVLGVGRLIDGHCLHLECAVAGLLVLVVDLLDCWLTLEDLKLEGELGVARDDLVVEVSVAGGTAIGVGRWTLDRD